MTTHHRFTLNQYFALVRNPRDLAGPGLHRLAGATLSHHAWTGHPFVFSEVVRDLAATA